ncbi:beta-1,3-galactosyltransferase 1-like [Saccoglossus kowalevskii]|uniref:Hexosyltransferase n=1 Tax=Saccoglossus kowalevskii TaxID=10224 RepID=A0ABM0MNI5_SACKO|nr:PREDICTED: beta-1,3-galactosyltransferase 1-like [Saccoglossus kowalevskii]
MRLEQIVVTTSFLYLLLIVVFICFYFNVGKGGPSWGSTSPVFGGGRTWLFADDDYSERMFNNTNLLSGEYIHLDQYSYLINQPKICSDHRDVFLLTLITTQHKNYKQRNAIRDTWASISVHEGKQIASVFLLAKSQDPRLMRLVDNESRKHRDIVEFDFQEDYLNLTLKTLLGMRWAVDYCPQSKYILKTDDDVFINPYTLVHNLTEMPRHDFAYGYAYYNVTPARNVTNKWFTTFDMYKGTKYPPYLVGTGYVLSHDVAAEVLSLGSTKRYLSWEDVFVGICLDELKIPIRHSMGFDTFSKYTDFREPCSFHSLFTSHRKNPLRLRYMWKVYTKYRRECIRRAAQSSRNIVVSSKRTP